MIGLIADSYWGFACKKISRKSEAKIYEWQGQSRIHVEDPGGKILIAYLNWRSIIDQIHCRFLLKICLWQNWSQILIKNLWVPKSVADFRRWFGCEQVEQGIDESRSNCSDIALGVPRLLRLSQRRFQINWNNRRAGL